MHRCTAYSMAHSRILCCVLCWLLAACACAVFCARPCARVLIMQPDSERKHPASLFLGGRECVNEKGSGSYRARSTAHRLSQLGLCRGRQQRYPVHDGACLLCPRAKPGTRSRESPARSIEEAISTAPHRRGRLAAVLRPQGQPDSTFRERLRHRPIRHRPELGTVFGVGERKEAGPYDRRGASDRLHRSTRAGGRRWSSTRGRRADGPSPSALEPRGGVLGVHRAGGQSEQT
jgi:hypothetical protein